MRRMPGRAGESLIRSDRDLFPFCGVFPSSSTVRKRDETALYILEARLQCAEVPFGGSVAILEYPLLPR